MLLETANAFRHGLFHCFFDEEPQIRISALKTLANVVDYWTVAWQDYLRVSWTPASPRLNRPPIARQPSNGSGVSPAPPISRTLIRRDSSFKMHFEDVFGLDTDDLTSALVTPRMLEMAPNPYLPLTPEKEDGWAAIPGLEYAISPTETSSFTDSAIRFSNRGLGDFGSSANRDVVWAGCQVAEEVWGLEEMKMNLENFYAWLLRFSIDCPFKDVRKGCREILKRAEVNSISSLLSHPKYRCVPVSKIVRTSSKYFTFGRKLGPRYQKCPLGDLRFSYHLERLSASTMNPGLRLPRTLDLQTPWTFPRTRRMVLCFPPKNQTETEAWYLV